ncbi:MAG: hypothetical protein Q9190_000010 [Brigantiaea leucoxantha]
MVGGHPTVDVDVPICAVFLFLYLMSAIANQTIFQLNRRKGHKFLMSWAMFGFSLLRIATHVLRIVWATRPSNARLTIAALIFTNLGVLVLYMVVLLLALRVFRATHPQLGWNSLLRKTLHVSYFLLGGSLVLTVAFTITTFYILDPTVRSVSLWIQRVSILYMLLFNVLSLILLLLAIFLPQHWPEYAENFGTGSMRAKLVILGVAVFFSVFIAGFRTGTVWSSPRLASNPAWYDSKAAFYVILFGFEIIVIYLFLFVRFDKRFWVPNGSNKPGDYSRQSLDNSTTVGTPSEPDREFEQYQSAKKQEGSTEKTAGVV